MANFTELACFADDYVAANIAKVRKFEDGLKLSILVKSWDSSFKIWTRWSGQLWSYTGKWMTYGASRMQVPVIRGRRVNSLLLAQERSKGLLLHEGFRDRVVATKAKAKISHPKMGNTLGLLTSKGESVFLMPLAGTLETGFPSEAGIPELWDTIVLVISG